MLPSQDADECIGLAPDFAKGYSRKGHLQFFMKEFDKALVTYDQGLAHDPTNEELREGKQRTLQAVAQVAYSPPPPPLPAFDPYPDMKLSFAIHRCAHTCRRLISTQQIG